MKTTMIAITIAAVALSNVASAESRPGVRVVALDAGFALVADMLKAEIAAEPIEGLPLGTIADTIGGVGIHVDDATLDLTVSDLGITAHPDTLRIDVGLEHVRLNLAVMKVSRRILGRSVSATCHGAAIHWGNRGPVPLIAEASIDVAAKRLALTPGRITHDVTSADYGVSGPERCDAPPGLSDIMRLAAKGALEGARPMIEPTLRRRFAAMLPQMADAATTALSPSFPFSFSGVPGLPARSGRFALFPLSVELTAGQMAVVAGTDVTVEERLTAAEPGLLALPLASFGLNPGIITDAFATLFPQGTDYIEIDEATAPGLRDVLDVRSAASIWPDLQHIALSRPYLKLWVRLAEAPQLATDVATQRVQADIPRLEMKFQIEQDRVWRDYFVMNVGVRTGVTTTLAQDSLSLSLADDTAVAVTGNWAPGYTPQVDVFEQDVAAFLFSTVFDYLSAAGPLTRVWVPTMVVGDRDVTLANPHVNGVFLNLDVVDVTP
jgi:hypothetical protein